MTKYKEVHLIGECYLSIIEMIRENFFDKQSFSSGNRESKFEAKIWLHGTTKGNIKGSLYVQCSPLMRQAICGVNTEEPRVQKSVSVIFGTTLNKTKLRKMREEVKTLDTLKKSLEDNEFNILGENQNKDKKKEEIDDMKENLNKMLKILEKTEMETMICFQYHSKEELVRTQEILIELGMN